MIKTEPLIIQKLLLYLLKLLKCTTLRRRVIDLVSQFHTVLVLFRDSKESSSYCSGSKVRSHAGPLKTKKLH